MFVLEKNLMNYKLNLVILLELIQTVKCNSVITAIYREGQTIENKLKPNNEDNKTRCKLLHQNQFSRNFIMFIIM